MNGKEYTALAMRTNDGNCTKRLNSAAAKLENTVDIGGILNASLGLSGEVGEFNDMVKKWVFHEKPIDIVHARKELGDIMWYVAMMCYSFGWDLDEIMQLNIDKLKARYPEGFDTARANNRDTADV
jgi:NTP pyrophosphatase (non-canonical NTP hydrolase)